MLTSGMARRSFAAIRAGRLESDEDRRAEADIAA
jgi:hypothetical protein